MPLARVLKKFAEVPDTWEAWALRVLTMCVALVLVACAVLFNSISGLREQISDGKQGRVAYQIDQTRRTCVMLVDAGISEAQLKDLGC